MSLCTPSSCCVDNDCPPNVEPVLSGFAIAPTIVVIRDPIRYNFLDNLNIAMTTVYNVHPCNRPTVISFVNEDLIALGIETVENINTLHMTMVVGVYTMFVNKACNCKVKL